MHWMALKNRLSARLLVVDPSGRVPLFRFVHAAGVLADGFGLFAIEIVMNTVRDGAPRTLL